MKFQQRNLPQIELIQYGLGVLFTALGFIPILLTFSILGVFVVETILFFQEVSPINFFTDTKWTPAFEGGQEFGILLPISSTLLVTTIALLFSIPIGLMAAIYLSEYAPPTMRRFLKPTLEALGGIPTVVYGYFAFLFLTPLLKATILPQISTFNGLSAGIVVGILITPTISSLSEDALATIPQKLREGGYALGFTKSEVILKIVIPAAMPGIISAFTLAASRALGETMIVAIAAGQKPTLTLNPLVPIETMTAFIIQVSLGTVTPGSLVFRTIFTVGFVLFLITFIFNSLGYWLLYLSQKQNTEFIRPHIEDNQFTRALYASPLAQPEPQNLKLQPYRFWWNGLFGFSTFAAAFTGLIFLLILFFDLSHTGLPRLSWDFLTSFASRKPEASGILAPLVGSLWLLILTGVIVFPFGVGGAIYLEEYCPKNWFNRLLEVNIANLAAVPSILYGLLGLELFVRILHPVTGGNTILAGALTLAVMVLPTLIITCRTALRTANLALRQAGYGVGMTHWQVLFHLVIPSALPGIFTGTLLSLSQVIGETAALIGVGAVAFIRFLPPLSLQGLQSEYTALPVQIFYWLQSSKDGVQANAAAATIVLLVIILCLNLASLIVKDFCDRFLGIGSKSLYYK